jgi:hypothetical protein
VLRERATRLRGTRDGDLAAGYDFAVQQYREMSRIVEPQMHVDAFGSSLARHNPHSAALQALLELRYGAELAHRSAITLRRCFDVAMEFWGFSIGFRPEFQPLRADVLAG